MNFIDDDYADSSDTEGDEVEKAFEEHQAIPLIDYPGDELMKLVLYIQQIFTCFDLADDEIGDSFVINAAHWLKDVSQPTLFVFFDQGVLQASADCPVAPVTSVTYFMRDTPGHVFTVDGFHDEVTFGSFDENPDETILHLMTKLYAPLILKDKQWDENIKRKLFTDLHSFMATLTDVSSKVGHMVILYIPNESLDLPVEEAASDKALVKRYESTLNYWKSQIRACLNEVQNLQYTLESPADEHEFWVYKFEVLSGIESQIESTSIEHILNVLLKSQSMFIANFLLLRKELILEVQMAKASAKFATLLVEPCLDLMASEWPNDLPAKLPNIIYLIRVISLNTEYYGKKKNTERLFTLLSTEIISFCKSKLDLTKIFNGFPRFGIKVCDMSVDCCVMYKQIFRRLVSKLQAEDFRESWQLNEAKIFSKIDIFIHRLNDLMEICESIIVFSRTDETVNIPPLKFGCHNAEEFTMMCRDVERKFGEGLEDIKNSTGLILNVNSNEWYLKVSNHKIVIRSLEEIVQNMLVNVFINISNVEEALDALTVLQNYAQCKNLKKDYALRVEQLWAMFDAELDSLNKDITGLEKKHAGCLPKFAGKSMILSIKLKKCERLKEQLVNAHYLPKVAAADVSLKTFESTKANIKKKIEENNQQWCSLIDPQPMSYMTNPLINRASGGHLECNINRQILPIFDEAKHFEFMDVPLPQVLVEIYPMARTQLIVYNKVVNVVLSYNRILDALSMQERSLFQQHIKSMDKKIVPGIFRLTYNDELTNEYISDCLKHLDEIQHFVDIYKIINNVNVRLFESIANGHILNLNMPDSTLSLEQFKRQFRQSRNDSVESIGMMYKRIIEHIIVVFEGFESKLTSYTAEMWVEYVRNIDALAEFAIVNCAKSTLMGVFTLLKGKSELKPEPFIKVDVFLEGREIVIVPSMGNIARALQRIYLDIIKSVSIFPRLNEKFDLVPSATITDFYEVVERDESFISCIKNINDVIELNAEKTTQYIRTWLKFQFIWELDASRFMSKFQESGLELKEFESRMIKLIDLESEVKAQDNEVTVTFLKINVSQLKQDVLNLVAKWKKTCKLELAANLQKKAENLDELLTSRLRDLEKSSKKYSEIGKALQLHQQSKEELRQRQEDFEEIKAFKLYLEKHDIEIPLAAKKQFEASTAKWNTYEDQLNDVYLKLLQQMERFKLTMSMSVITDDQQ